MQVNSCIITLDLADNSIHDRGGAAVARLLRTSTHLEALDMSGNACRMSTCTELAASLAPRLSQLRRLVMKCNGLGDREVAALADGLANNNTLAVLDLSRNQIAERGCAALGAAVSQNAALEARICLEHSSVGMDVKGANLNVTKDWASLAG